MVSELNYLHNNDNKQLIIQKQKKLQKNWMWLILIGCFVLQMIPYCISVNLNNIFVGSDWNFWLDGNNVFIGLGFTIGSLVSAFCSPLIARLFGGSINYRLVYSLGIVTATIGFICPAFIAIITSTTSKLPSIGIVITLLWIAIILAQVGTMIFSGIGINNLISIWWPPEKRGFALGITFAGSSLGSIWLKQILTVLSNKFGNISPNPQKGLFYPIDGQQYITYFIFGAICLVIGLIVVLFICKKPIPHPELASKKVKKNNLKDVAASPLDTSRYPVYWVLCVGFLILQMGTIHASMNGLIIANTTIITHSHMNYNDVMGLGGSIFGACCILGNVISGVLNDKLKPSKSIFVAGMMQCLSIFCLMYSVKNENLIYLYFVLAGLSVYIYTTMPSYISGRLYGVRYSNNHVAILSIFLAIGFAIVNSISGLLTGPTGFDSNYVIKNPHEMFGVVTAGNFLALELFAILSMGIGTIIVSISCAMIRQKGINGIKEYSPTKYTFLVNLKYGLIIKWISTISLISRRNIIESNIMKKYNKLSSKHDAYYQCYTEFEDLMHDITKRNKLTEAQIEILTLICFNGIVNLRLLKRKIKTKKLDEEIKWLIKNNYIYKKDATFYNATFYWFSPTYYKKIRKHTAYLRSKYPKILKENNNAFNKLEKFEFKYNQNILKTKNKLIQFENKLANITDDTKKIAQLDNKINKLLKIKQEKINKNSNDCWKQYLIDVNYNQKIALLESKKTIKKTNLQKQIKKLENKIDDIQHKKSYFGFQNINGHILYNNYLNNKHATYEKLVRDKIKSKISIKENTIKTNRQNCINKINTLNSNKKKIFSEIDN